MLYAAVRSVHFSCALDCLCLFVAGARVEQLLSIERADFLLLSQWTRCSLRREFVLGLVDLESVAPAARKWIHKCGLRWPPCCGDSRSINVALGPGNFVPPSHPRTGCSAGVLGHGCLARGVLNYRTRCSSLQLRVGIRQGPFPHELSLSMSESESGSTLLAGVPNPFTDFCERLDTSWRGLARNIRHVLAAGGSGIAVQIFCPLPLLIIQAVPPVGCTKCESLTVVCSLIICFCGGGQRAKQGPIEAPRAEAAHLRLG